MAEADAVALALQRGDEGALATLYDRYGRAVYHLALRVTGDAATAEEISLDTFLQVWRQAQRFDSQHGTIASWIFSIARSRAIDRVRAATAVKRKLSNEMVIAAPEQRPDELAELAQKQRLVRQALESLNAPQRRALELAYYEGLSHAQIAERLGEPLGTIKTRIRQAMTVLRKMLEGARAGAS